MVSGTQAAPSSRGEIAGSDPANVPLSKPSEMNGLSDRRVTSAAVTSCTLVTALCEKKAPLCGRERQSIVQSLFGELAKGSKILTVQLWHRSKQGHNVQWQEQVVIVSHSEKYCGLQCDIVHNNRSFNTTSFLKPLPAKCSHFFFFSSSTDQMKDDYSKKNQNNYPRKEIV